jgi:hypothetical protein
MADVHEQTLTHLRLLASSPGFWEVRALRRVAGSRMTPRGSFWIVATATTDGLLYERLEQALAWADAHDRAGTELFIGVNARSSEGKTKASVPAVTCCFADVDLAGGDIDDALAVLTSDGTPIPSFVVNSGYGLHTVWLLREPSRDKVRWRVVQQAITRTFAELGADPACAPDEARVLRLVPYPNRKLSPEGVPTSLVLDNNERYDLPHLLSAFTRISSTTHCTVRPPPLPDAERDADAAEMPAAADNLTVEEMEELVETTAAVRTLLARYIRATFKPGLHFGLIPVSEQETSKPTLLKPGAELICLLFRWRAQFLADLETLQMYGPGTTGVFAYICQLLDPQGQVVGQGRGVAELRETSLTSANMAVKMAEKRAYVDAVLRAAGLSQYFTQDLEDMLLLPPPQEAADGTTPATDAGGSTGELCSRHQRQAIRSLLLKAGRTEQWLLGKLTLRRLDELPADRAEQVIHRLGELARERQKTQQ